MRFGARSYVRRSAVLPVPRPSRTGSGGQSGEEQGTSVAEAAIPRPANQAQERTPKPGNESPPVWTAFAAEALLRGGREARLQAAIEERIKRR